MSENEHYDRAKKRLHNGTTNEVTRAQAEATLALAYEQRTANLIALWSNPQSRQEDMNGNPMTYSINSDMPGKLIEEIIQRLGILP